MIEFARIVLTAALALIGGLAIFAIQRFMLEPINEQARVIGRICNALVFHGKDLNAPAVVGRDDETTIKERQNAADRFRQLAADLTECSQAIRWYRLWAYIGLIPKTHNVDGAIADLIGLSNSMFHRQPEFKHQEVLKNWHDSDRIMRLLNIRRWGKQYSSSADLHREAPN